MKDKVINWLEENMNKQGYFYFQYSSNIDNLINCYFKVDNSHCCVFYKNVIERLLEEEENI